MGTASQTIAEKVAALASSKGVTISQSWTTHLAAAITRLADDDVDQDDTERLLVVLRQEGHLDSATFGRWLYQHLLEVRPPGNNMTSTEITRNTP